ncbi:hypothetical protein [Chitinophaga sp. XS-30]|uniref:hypothetical protein n=1 Tax=Chitinophaga sp. XS-30 TaxID=2604421 RepID=UPI0011DD31CA|nr:hypothetical protein [Chitinophaga sp. XS-30]QEH39468.1 hypothetical protein FW415_00695 [Chitinophaga sp. XS-30]
MDKRDKALRELAKDFTNDLTANGMGDVIQPENPQHKRSTEDFLFEYFNVIFNEVPNTNKLRYNENKRQNLIEFQVATRNDFSNIDATYTHTFQCRLDDNFAGVRHSKTVASLKGRPAEEIQLDMYPIPAPWRSLDPDKTDLAIKEMAENIIRPLETAGYTADSLNGLNDNGQSLTDQLTEYLKVIDLGMPNDKHLPINHFPGDTFGHFTLKSNGRFNEKPVNFIYLFEFDNESSTTSYRLINIAVRLPQQAPKVEKINERIPPPLELIDSVMLDLNRQRKMRKHNIPPGKYKRRKR